MDFITARAPIVLMSTTIQHAPMTFRLPPLSTLRLFEAAGRARSFAEAAKEAGVTASAVSHAVQSLEDWLGAALFAQKRGTLRLTPAGADYHKAVHQAFAALAADLARPEARTDRLRLTIVPTFAERILVPRLQGFAAQHPGLSIAIDTSHRLATFPDDGFDAGIRLGSGNWPGLHVQHLLTETLVPVCAPDLFAASTDLRLVPDDRLISITSTDDGWGDWCAANDRAAPDPEKGLRVDTLQMALTAAAQGMGIAMARLPSVVPELRTGGLMALSDKPVACRQSYWLVAAPGATERPLIAAFSAWLLDEMDRLQLRAGKAA
ncbi:LysR substrate-binding domain-containing protein [Pseudorhodoplanes sp.]|uniref:LysR substrate-binding domain-containing protein n=1 Tax=Pseudorhodoplanes sp. TaxID=1934341 RepID=UPI0039191D68